MIHNARPQDSVTPGAPINIEIVLVVTPQAILLNLIITTSSFFTTCGTGASRIGCRHYSEGCHQCLYTNIEQKPAIEVLD